MHIPAEEMRGYTPPTQRSVPREPDPPPLCQGDPKRHCICLQSDNPPSSPRGWAGGRAHSPANSPRAAVRSLDFSQARVCLEMHDSNDGHTQLVGCFGRIWGAWGKGKGELLLGEIRNGRGCPPASKDRWQRWNELIPAGENWLQASESVPHWPSRWKSREIVTRK